jgi:competence ComEA-like helix-hairpin-helix protein
MRLPKLNYFNTDTKSFKFLLLVFFVFLTANCIQKDSQQVLSKEKSFEMSENAVNINTASLEELQKIPNIGAKTAAKVIEHREKFGKFRKPEHLLLIDRISDARFREMRGLIKVE